MRKWIWLAVAILIALAGWAEADQQADHIFYLPKALTTIESAAFAGDTIEKIYLSDAVRFIADDAFDHVGMFYVEEDSYAHRWCESHSYPHVYMPKGLEWDLDSQGYVITGYHGEKTELVLPDEFCGNKIYRIGQGAFAGSGLTSIRLPAFLTEIESEAFYECMSLTTVENLFNPSLQIVGDFAFYGCTSLTISDPVVTWNSLGYNAFCNCQNITGVLTIPHSTALYDLSYAFAYTGITEAAIPETIFVDDYTFEGCQTEIPQTGKQLHGQMKTV